MSKRSRKGGGGGGGGGGGAVGSGLDGMKSCYKEAKKNGDREEEARWANQIGHALKEHGDYVEALTWFRLDYDISLKRKPVDQESPRVNLMPTCQSLGEIYLRLEDFDEALIYQKRHLDMAKELKDLVEQQRASTQLGRTFMDMYEQKDCVTALPKAKKYLSMAMELACVLKANPPVDKVSPSSFVVELVDAYNNLGMLKMVVEEPDVACKLLQQGLALCEEEEVGQTDAARTRLHHNLGRLHLEQRQWDLAMKHILKDIEICQDLPHPQGEAKGLNNLGEVHFKCQRYMDALQCYHRALNIVQKLQDEDHLLSIVQANIEVVQQAMPKMKEFQEALKQHIGLQRKVEAAKGSVSERRLYQQEFKALQSLLAQAHELQAWEQHLKLGKRLKKVVTFLGDMEKLGDALDLIGESYYNLRKYQKAQKWHFQSWQVCKRVKHLEGQAVAKNNYGNALDAAGDWNGALQAYLEAYEIAKCQGDAHLISQQISAIENLQYCYIVRLEHPEEASELDDELKKLKQLKEVQELDEEANSRCSETDIEEDDVSAQPKTWPDTDSSSPASSAHRQRMPAIKRANNGQWFTDRLHHNENSGSIVTEPVTPGHRKHSRMVLSDEHNSSDELKQLNEVQEVDEEAHSHHPTPDCETPDISAQTTSWPGTNSPLPSSVQSLRMPNLELTGGVRRFRDRLHPTENLRTMAMQSETHSHRKHFQIVLSDEEEGDDCAMALLRTHPSKSRVSRTAKSAGVVGDQAAICDQSANIIASEGTKKDQTKVQVEGGHMLHNSFKRREEEFHDPDAWHRVECSHNSFQGRFLLPANLNVKKLKVSVDNGVLTVTIPKLPKPNSHVCDNEID